MDRTFAPFRSDLWRNRHLLWQFTLRNVELRHKGSHLGLIWSILQPLLMLGLYMLVLGYINQGKFGVRENETWIDFGLGIFLGLSLFHFLAEVLNVAPSLIVANANFVKKVVFPLEVLPTAVVGGAAFHLLISLSMVLVGLAVWGPGLDAGVLWLPVIVFPLILLALGFAWSLAAFGVFLRDIAQILQFLSAALLWASAIFYSAAKIPPAAWAFLRFNPLLIAIEMARDAVLWHRPFPLIHLTYLYGVGIVACLLGYFLFRRLRPAFADVL